jgi:hypothetical protein
MICGAKWRPQTRWGYFSNYIDEITKARQEMVDEIDHLKKNMMEAKRRKEAVKTECIGIQTHLKE